jgi:hypothetical protein
MITEKNYALVDYTARNMINLRQYHREIEKAANITFRDKLYDIVINESYFNIKIRTLDGTIRRGLLINFGKVLAKQTPQLCQSAMKTYKSSKHPLSRQLFKAI